MKRLVWILVIALISGCKPASRAKPDVPWTEFRTSSEDLRKEHPSDEILIVFTAQWSLSCKVLEHYLQRPEVREVLDRHKARLYLADCTKAGSAGTKEMVKDGEQCTPFAAAAFHPNGKMNANHLNLTSVPNFIVSLETVFPP